MYALYGRGSGDLLTLHGRVIVHDNQREMEYLFPSAVIVKVNERDVKKRSPFEVLPLRDHPGLQHVSWPLNRDDFR